MYEGIIIIKIILRIIFVSNFIRQRDYVDGLIEKFRFKVQEERFRLLKENSQSEKALIRNEIKRYKEYTLKLYYLKMELNGLNNLEIINSRLEEEKRIDWGGDGYVFWKIDDISSLES